MGPQKAIFQYIYYIYTSWEYPPFGRVSQLEIRRPNSGRPNSGRPNSGHPNSGNPNNRKYIVWAFEEFNHYFCQKWDLVAPNIIEMGFPGLLWTCKVMESLEILSEVMENFHSWDGHGEVMEFCFMPRTIKYYQILKLLNSKK